MHFQLIILRHTLLVLHIFLDVVIFCKTLTLVSCVTALINMMGIAGCSSFSLDSAMDPALRSHRAPWK